MISVILMNNQTTQVWLLKSSTSTFSAPLILFTHDIPKENSLPSKEQTVKEITDGEEIEATPLKRKKSSRNKENVIDGSEKKKRAKDSEEHKKSKGSKSASKKRNKSSKSEIQVEGL